MKEIDLRTLINSGNVNVAKVTNELKRHRNVRDIQTTEYILIHTPYLEIGIFHSKHCSLK